MVTFPEELELLHLACGLNFSFLFFFFSSFFFLLFLLADVLMSIALIKLYYMDPTIPLLQQNRTCASPVTAKSKKKWLSHLIH